MRKRLFSFAQVIKFCKISAHGGGLTPKPTLRTPLHGLMLTHHNLECAKSRLNPESHCLINGSFLLNESFCKKYLFSVASL